MAGDRPEQSRTARRPLKRNVIAGLGVAAILALGTALLDDALGLYAGDGPNAAEESLHFAVPVLPEPSTVRRYDAAWLSREGHAKHLRDLIFLPGTEVSRNIREVSVWPASDSVWIGGVAQAHGRCFVIMADFGTGLSPDRQIELVPAGTPCSARAAARTAYPEVTD